jgi:GNAT superfamily N-acetyltransferase
MLSVKPLSPAEIKYIYEKHMTVDFPANELKPLSAIEHLLKKGRYLAYGLFDDDSIRAYAFFAAAGKSRSLLLDYFAVKASGRSRGFGSKFLRMLKNEIVTAYPGVNSVIAEVERVRFAPDELERITRERRIAFYKRNGFKGTRIKSLLFGVDYSILYWPLLQDSCATATGTDTADYCDAGILQQLELIYLEMLPIKIVRQHVKLWIAEKKSDKSVKILPGQKPDAKAGCN